MTKLIASDDIVCRRSWRVPVRAFRMLMMLALLQTPVTGFCTPASGWFQKLFDSKGEHMREVAVKIAELPEQYGDIIVRGLEFSPDGKHLAVRSAYQTVNIWDWQAGRIVRSLEMARGAEEGLTTEPFRFSPDGRFFVACHSRATGQVVARVWNSSTWEIVRDIIDDIPGTGCNAVGFTPDGRFLIRILDRMPDIAGDTLIVYDVESWQPAWGLRTVPFYTYSLATNPDGKLFAVGGEVRNPRSWPFDTPVPTFGDPPFQNMRLIALVDLERRRIVRTITNTMGVMNRKGRLAWSPDGAHIASAGGHGLQIFDVQSGEQIVGITPRWASANTSLRYSPDGRYLIEGTANEEKTGWGRIWDGQHRELLQEIPFNVGSLAVSRDGRHLATGTDGKTIIWKLK